MDELSDDFSQLCGRCQWPKGAKPAIQQVIGGELRSAAASKSAGLLKAPLPFAICPSRSGGHDRGGGAEGTWHWRSCTIGARIPQGCQLHRCPLAAKGLWHLLQALLSVHGGLATPDQIRVQARQAIQLGLTCLERPLQCGPGQNLAGAEICVLCCLTAALKAFAGRYPHRGREHAAASASH